MALGKVHRIAEFNDVAQEVGAMAEALQDTGHLLTARLGSPLVVNLGHFAGRLSVFYDLDFCFVIRHHFQLCCTAFRNIAWAATSRIHPFE